MATISGTLFNATSPRPNVTIMLVATRTTASVINTATDISITTDADGAYSFDCNQSAYLVMLIENGSGKQVGYIQVYPDSIDGTLEQYLTSFNPDILTPDVVREVKEAAASALESMNNAKIGETNAAKSASDANDDAQQVANDKAIVINDRAEVASNTIKVEQLKSDTLIAKNAADQSALVSTQQAAISTDESFKSTNAANIATQKALEANNDSDQAAIDAKTASDAVVTIEPLVVTATDKAKESSDSSDLARGYSDTAKLYSESATASESTATEKAAEAKDSADIASDSMNFKTETILIPKWESPEVTFIHATKTFEFKLQDLSIYKLTPALWDMLNRELVSFFRSTKAWWNGVEYAPNEPRIKDGKLLIEGQATNSMYVEFPYDFKAAASRGDFITTVVGDFANISATTNIDSPAIANISLDEFAHYNSTMTMSLVVFMTPDFLFSVSVFATEARRLVFDSTKPLPDQSENISFFISGNEIHFRVTGVFASSGNKIFRIEPNASVDYGTARDFRFKNLMIENGVIATSYIPTHGTAVTRAADIPTVRDK